MANQDHNRVFGYAELTALAGRFAEHAAAISNPARQDVAKDLLLAARMAHKFASCVFVWRTLLRRQSTLPTIGALPHSRSN
jgi:hypothetical protein